MKMKNDDLKLLQYLDLADMNATLTDGAESIISNYHYYDDDGVFPLDGGITPEVDPTNLTFTLENYNRSILRELGYTTDDQLYADLRDYDVVGVIAGGSGGGRYINNTITNLSGNCPFIGLSEKFDMIEWVYKVPPIFLLACNTAFLIWIMKVLILHICFIVVSWWSPIGVVLFLQNHLYCKSIFQTIFLMIDVGNEPT